jgi:anti-anti-sigma factor
MAVVANSTGERLVLSPSEALVAGGPAEEFEQRVQGLFRDGYRHLVTDLRGVSRIDSAGIRALVRGYTTSQRLGGTFTLVGVDARMRTTLQLANLDKVFDIYESVEEARVRKFEWRTVGLSAAGALVIGAMLWGGLHWTPIEVAEPGILSQVKPRVAEEYVTHPLIELAKLVAAAGIGLLITAVQRRMRRDKPLSPSLEQSQVLLCVASAMVMIVVGSNFARAFGIVGVAGVIRFRTPVEDPKDMTIIFLLMGLGMAAGIGAFAVAGLGTLFLCLLLMTLEVISTRKPRTMMVELEAEGRECPSAHVQGVFARNRVLFEPREVSQGKEVRVRYHATLGFTTSLEDLSEQLLAGGKAGIKAVSWEAPKKSE